MDDEWVSLERFCLIKAAVSSPAGPASARPLFWPSMLSAYHFLYPATQ